MNGVADLVRGSLPDGKVHSLEYLAEGDFCEAFLLNNHQVVRVPKHEEAARSLVREACLLRRISPHLSVPVPSPKHVPGSSPGEPSFSVHDWISGTELTKEVWRTAPEAARIHLAQSVGRFLRELHHVDSSVGRSCGLEVMDHGGLVRTLEAQIRREPGSLLPGRLRARLGLHFRNYLAGGVGWSYEPRLLHADVSPGHVLVDLEGGEITGVLDWGDAAVGDPARDFIFLYEDWGGDFLDLALEGYGPEDHPGFRPRILLRYLADQLDWTLKAGEAGREEDLRHGVAALDQGLEDLEGLGPLVG